MQAILKYVLRHVRTFLTDLRLLYVSATNSINAHISGTVALWYRRPSCLENLTYMLIARCRFATVPGLWASFCLSSAFQKYLAIGVPLNESNVVISLACRDAENQVIFLDIMRDYFSKGVSLMGSTEHIGEDHADPWDMAEHNGYLQSSSQHPHGAGAGGHDSIPSFAACVGIDSRFVVAVDSDSPASVLSTQERAAATRQLRHSNSEMECALVIASLISIPYAQPLVWAPNPSGHASVYISMEGSASGIILLPL